MHVICSQADLDLALRALKRITKDELFPLYHSVLFSATLDPNSEQGILTLMGMGMYGMGGMITRLPAVVKHRGEALVPIEPLTEYITGLCPGNLTLSQEREEMSAAEGQLPSSLSSVYTAPSMTFPLHIESIRRSDTGATSTHRAKLATWEQWEQYRLPPMQQWLTKRVPIAVLKTSSLKEAIACCMLFANSSKHKAPEIDGILLSIDANSISFTTMSGPILVSHRILREHPTSFSFDGLFSGNALSWVKKVLSDGEITLSLVQDEQTSKPVLLLSAESMIWFCRSTDAPFPHTWTNMLQIPHETEVCVRRKDLTAPLKFFASSAAQTYEALSLFTEENTLWMCSVAGKNAVVQDQRKIPLVSSSADLNILVNPKRLKQVLRYIQGNLILIQIGHFERQEDQIRKKFDFLRMTSEQTTTMMIVKQNEPASPSNSSQKTGSREGEAEPILSSQEV